MQVPSHVVRVLSILPSRVVTVRYRHFRHSTFPTVSLYTAVVHYRQPIVSTLLELSSYAVSVHYRHPKPMNYQHYIHMQPQYIINIIITLQSQCIINIIFTCSHSTLSAVSLHIVTVHYQCFRLLQSQCIINIIVNCRNLTSVVAVYYQHYRHPYLQYNVNIIVTGTQQYIVNIVAFSTSLVHHQHYRHLQLQCIIIIVSYSQTSLCVAAAIPNFRDWCCRIFKN